MAKTIKCIVWKRNKPTEYCEYESTEKAMRYDGNKIASDFGWDEYEIDLEENRPEGSIE